MRIFFSIKFLIASNLKTIYFLNDAQVLMTRHCLLTKYNIFLWVRWVLAKNLANFVPLPWKQDYPYYRKWKKSMISDKIYVCVIFLERKTFIATKWLSQTKTNENIFRLLIWEEIHWLIKDTTSLLNTRRSLMEKSRKVLVQIINELIWSNTLHKQ